MAGTCKIIAFETQLSINERLLNPYNPLLPELLFIEFLVYAIQKSAVDNFFEAAILIVFGISYCRH